MSMFGLKEAEVAQLIRAVTREDLVREEVAERFARATWTGLAEPGDRIAGILVATVGAEAALTMVAERWNIGRAYPSVADVMTEEDLRLAFDRWQPRIGSSTALIAVRQAARFGARLLVPADPEWPSGVGDLDVHAPIALWVRGRTDVLGALDRSIALVGARAATGYGEHVTAEASAGLVDRGYAIVSGAAYGIDGMAHRAALASSGTTVAFLAGGVDRFYPSGHDALLTRIVESGAVISELPCGAPPTKWRFLQRNRLIAAASAATVVLEAGWRSGSLNTAGHASALGRPLGAVPGPVTSAASAGCHKLIRDQLAMCVTNADEMAELAPHSTLVLRGAVPAPADPVAPPGVRREDSRVLDALSARSGRAAEDVARRSGMSVAEVSATLGRLHLDGTVHETARGWRRT